MKRLFIHLLPLCFIFAVISCNGNSELKNENERLKGENKALRVENDSLRNLPQNKSQNDNATEKSRKKGKYSRSQFEKLVMGKTREEVLKLLGKPDKTYYGGGPEYWSYYGITYDPITKNIDYEASVWFGAKTCSYSATVDEVMCN